MVAALVSTATSSSIVAMSSSRRRRLDAIQDTFTPDSATEITEESQVSE
jgi:hypothetical protein